MYSIKYPYHLCPVCGMQSGNTSGVCSKHISVTYDAQGNVLRYTDWNWAKDTYRFAPATKDKSIYNDNSQPKCGIWVS